MRYRLPRTHESDVFPYQCVNKLEREGAGRACHCEDRSDKVVSQVAEIKDFEIASRHFSAYSLYFAGKRASRF